MESGDGAQQEGVNKPREDNGGVSETTTEGGGETHTEAVTDDDTQTRDQQAPANDGKESEHEPTVWQAWDNIDARHSNRF